MSCKSLPEGVCNFPIRITAQEHEAWGKFTYALNARDGTNRSMGDVVREAMMKGAESLDSSFAESVKAIRTEHLRMKRGITVAVAGFLVIGLSIFGIDQDMRRGRTSRTSVKSQRRTELS